MKKVQLLILFVALIFLNQCSSDGCCSDCSPDDRVSENVKVLDEELLENVTISADSTVLYFSRSLDHKLKEISENDIIVGDLTTNTPDGLLVKVTKKTESGGTIILNVENATLSDVFKQASIQFEGRLSANSDMYNKAVSEGVILRKDMSKRGDDYFYLEVDKDLYEDNSGNKVHLQGSIQIDPSVIFNIDIDEGLERVHFEVNLENTADVTFSAESEFYSIEKEYEIAKFPLPRFKVYIYNIPVIVKPLLTVDVGITGSASCGMETKASIHESYTLGLMYEDKRWKPISDYSRTLDGEIELTAGAEFKGYIGPQINLLLYGVAGPYVDINGYVECQTDVTDSPWLKLFVGIEAGAGVQVRFLGKEIVDYYLPGVLGYKNLVYQIDKPLNKSPIQPSNPTPTDNADDRETNISLNWSCSDPDGDSLTYDLYFGTSSNPPLEPVPLLSSSYSKNDLVNGTTYYWKIVAKDGKGGETSGPVWSFSTKNDDINHDPDVPSSPSPSHSARDQELNVSLDWSCSDPDGDSLSYDLYFGTLMEPPLKEEGLTSSSITMNESDLEYVHTYYWRIVAKDGKGGETSSPVWGFSTRADDTNNPPTVSADSPRTSNPYTNYLNFTTPTFDWNCRDRDGDPLIFKLYISNYGSDPFSNPLPRFPIEVTSSTRGANYLYKSGTNFANGGEVLYFLPSSHALSGSGHPSCYSWSVMVSDDNGNTWVEASSSRHFGISD
ncbi:MAG: hypothetical protein GY754_33070 [bacterium]|nr:hypothetical protein [bacterium]